MAGISPTDYTNINSHFKFGADEKGVARYIFAHVRFKNLGAVMRITTGHAQSTLNGKLGTISGKSRLQQIWELDVSDGTANNLSLYSALNDTDQGKAHFENIIMGITWHGGERFKVTLGMSTNRGRDMTGAQFSSSGLERIAGTSIGTTQGLDDKFVTNAVGEEDKNKAVFLRTSFSF